MRITLVIIGLSIFFASCGGSSKCNTCPKWSKVDTHQDKTIKS